MLDSQLGVCPIHAEHPAGSNPRDGDAFALLEAEINKRLDLNAQAPTDWPLVCKLSAGILRDEGKDLSVGTWLLLGWTNCKGATGLVSGVRVLHDLHVHYWDTMTPPAARLRGRRNQMEWLLQELEAILTQNSSDWVALEPQQHDDLIADWDALDAMWQDRDDQAPALFRLRRMLMELARSEGDDASDEANSSDASSQSVSEAKNGSAESGISGAVDASSVSGPATSDSIPASADTVQHTARTASTGVVASSAVASPSANGSDGNASVVPDSAAEVERVIDQGFDAMDAVLRDLPDDLIMMPVLYRLNRVRAWLTLDALPPSVEGVSRIPAPPSADQDGLQRLVEADDPQSVLRFAELRLTPYRFWLDLNRIAYQAAQALPEGQPIADAIAQESLNLLQRLPGLQDLSFNNNQPFADSATHDWLASLAGDVSVPVKRTERAGSIQSGVSADTLSMATLLAAAGAETQAAARLLDVVAARLQSGSDQFIQR